MIPKDRREEILNLLSTHKYMSVEELAKLMFISESTIRRDLAYLEKEGSLKRTRGGASYLSPFLVKWPFVFRNKTNMKEKIYIAKLAASFVQDGDSIFIDSSSTGLCLAKALIERKNLNVLTYGMSTAQVLAEEGNAYVECVCGHYFPGSASIYGKEACDFIKQHYAKTCFVSGCGFSAEHGLSDYAKEEAALKKTFHECSDQTIVLVDHSKFEQKFFWRDLDFSEINVIITDRPLPENIDERCYHHDIQVIYE